MDRRNIRRALRNRTPKEITNTSHEIRALAQNRGTKEITSGQGQLDLGIECERDVDGIGMGVLSDGTPYLNQRGLAALCGVQNAHIGTISSQWNEEPEKPRIRAIKDTLQDTGLMAKNPHVKVRHKNIIHYCYPAEVCLAILEYYAFDAGANCQAEARHNFRRLAGSKLRELIYSQVGYDPTGLYKDRFRKWHERLSLNYQSAPAGHFSVFNEAGTIIYQIIEAGAAVDEKTVVDISIGQLWSRHWEENFLDDKYGPRIKYPHRFPQDHPQSKSNPQDAWCYPLAALGSFRQWLQEYYVAGGSFRRYLEGKAKRGALPPSMAQLAISAIEQPLIGSG